ncbi:MAG: response regulator transcription factor [Armatimonadetes bacterium]|nr:response regulator transcription factor [Anaerolineae bacterium]
MYKILIVDDDLNILKMVEQMLIEMEGYTVVKARSGLEALKLAQSDKPDMCILDVGMPHMDGVALCRALRAMPTVADVPILFLTAGNNSYTVADALEAGGDDYVRKPFAIRELAARVRAHLRRVKRVEDMPRLHVVRKTYQAYVNGREINFTRIEFDLLQFLVRMPGHWYTTQELLEKVWLYPVGVGDTALVRNHVRNVRRKLEDNPDKPAIIQSRHGRGYSIRAEVSIE